MYRAFSNLGLCENFSLWYFTACLGFLGNPRTCALTGLVWGAKRTKQFVPRRPGGAGGDNGGACDHFQFLYAYCLRDAVDSLQFSHVSHVHLQLLSVMSVMSACIRPFQFSQFSPFPKNMPCLGSEADQTVCSKEAWGGGRGQWGAGDHFQSCTPPAFGSGPQLACSCFQSCQLC